MSESFGARNIIANAVKGVIRARIQGEETHSRIELLDEINRRLQTKGFPGITIAILAGHIRSARDEIRRERGGRPTPNLPRHRRPPTS